MVPVLRKLRRALLAALAHDVLGSAKAAAYSAILCLFPTILVVTTVIAMAPESDSLRGELKTSFTELLPADTMTLLHSYFTNQKVRSGQVVFSSTLISLLAVIYHFGTPRRQLWRYIIPGASGAAVMWFVSTLAYGFYIRRFSSYSVVYGSLGTLIATLVWLYITSLSVLMGAEFNAQFYPKPPRLQPRHAFHEGEQNTAAHRAPGM